MAGITGVFPVFKNKFKIGASQESLKPIAEMESFSVKVDGSVQEWTPMDTEGWMKRLMTGKSITVSLKGKRCIGDEGNDYVYELSWKNGLECDAFFEWEFPSSGKISFNCVINVTTPGGGDSTNVDGLEFDIMSSGKPTYTPPVGAEG